MSNSSLVYYDHMFTDIGELIIAAGAEGVQNLFFRERHSGNLPETWQYNPASLRDPISQLKEYFAGERRQFDFPLAPRGTNFQVQVWRALREIPFGTTISYGELAEKIGNPKGFRAVGNANGKNPIIIVQACHRVVNSDGTLGGFSSGLHRKKYLLGLEKYGGNFRFR